MRGSVDNPAINLKLLWTQRVLYLWLVCLPALGVATSVALDAALNVAHGADVVASFDDPEQSRLYHSLLREYRCLKCQNQNLADSNASLAGDLRREIRQQIIAGKTRDDIDGYLVARYGEFVLYRPRFSMKTAVLWLGPFLLLLVGLASVYAMSRKRALTREQRLTSTTITPSGNDQLAARLEKARRLLND